MKSVPFFILRSITGDHLIEKEIVVVHGQLIIGHHLLVESQTDESDGVPGNVGSGKESLQKAIVVAHSLATATTIRRERHTRKENQVQSP